MDKNQKKLESLIKETIKILKENNQITKIRNKKGENVVKYRKYLKQSKEIVDKIKKITNSSVNQIKMNIIKLEGVKKENLKLKKKLALKKDHMKKIQESNKDKKKK